jgi:hypothetical protein
MSHSTELRAQLVQSIDQLESELVALRSALAALDASGEPVAKPTRQRRSRRVQDSEIVPAGKIESLLGGSDGITTADIARATNGGHEQILSILKELEQDGKAHRSGARRSTRWHAGPTSAARSNGDAPRPARATA